MSGTIRVQCDNCILVFRLSARVAFEAMYRKEILRRIRSRSEQPLVVSKDVLHLYTTNACIQCLNIYLVGRT